MGEVSEGVVLDQSELGTVAFEPDKGSGVGGGEDSGMSRGTETTVQYKRPLRLILDVDDSALVSPKKTSAMGAMEDHRRGRWYCGGIADNNATLSMVDSASWAPTS